MRNPKQLFKYVGPDRIDIIEKLLIRFSPPSRFNDPFESRSPIDGLQDPKVLGAATDKADGRLYRTYVLQCAEDGTKPMGFDQFQKKQQNMPRLMEKLLHHDADIFLDRVSRKGQKFWDDKLGILSLAVNGNDLLMWAHYADSHRGVLIEFDVKHPFFRQPTAFEKMELGAIVPVQYSDERPRYLLGEPVSPQSFCIKSKEWEREQEWRIFQLLEDCAETLRLPSDTIHLFKLPPKAIKRIIAGCNMQPENRVRLFNAVTDNPQLRHVQLWEAVPDPYNFALRYQRSRSPHTTYKPWAVP
jgi:hypothetical protein